MEKAGLGGCGTTGLAQQSGQGRRQECSWTFTGEHSGRKPRSPSGDNANCKGWSRLWAQPSLTGKGQKSHVQPGSNAPLLLPGLWSQA